MKKINIVRQNRCDGEMNFLFFACFFLYTALQFFSGQIQGFRFANAANLLLYMIFVPGFLFLMGYRFGWNLRTLEGKEAKDGLLRAAFRCYGYFLFLAVGQEFCVKKLPLRYVLTEILTVVEIPSVSAVFFSMALTLLIVWIFFDRFCRSMQNEKKMTVLAVLCLLGAMLWTNGDTYAVTAAFTGSSMHQAVPGVPYFVFFLFGLWIEKKKPGFDQKLCILAAAVTAVSVLLYRTPLRSLCRVTISFLFVYLFYVLAEVLSDLTLRFKLAKFVSTTVERVYLIYTAALLVLSYFGILENKGGIWVIAAAAGLFIALYGIIFLFQEYERIYTRMSHFFENRIRHKTAVYFVLYTAAFALLLVLVFFEFIHLDKSFIWVGDGVTQYYPRALYFCRYIRELAANFLSGNFVLPMYDFRLGFGTEITYSLEPLYFLYALFGEDHIEFTYNLVTILRFYLAGITSSILMLYFKKGYFATFLGSVVYVFCGFSLYGGAKHTMFMIPVIMLPLLILSIEEIFRKRRWYLCTIFVAVSLFSNYYYLYMNTIAMGIYFIVRFGCQRERKEKTVRKFIQRALVISGSYLLGVGMSCIVLATTFGLYLGSDRSGSFQIHTPSLFFYSANRLVRTFLTFLTTANSPGDWLKLGYLPIALFAVIFLFLRKGRKELKLFCAVAAVFLAFPAAGFVFSGFSAVINRWCYMLSLLVGFIVADCYEEMLHLKKREWYVLLGVTVLYGFLVYFGDIQITQSTRYTKLAFLLLAATLLVLMFCQTSYQKLTKAAKQSMMLLLTAMLVFVNGYTEFALNDEIDAYKKNGKTEKAILQTPLTALDQIEDDSFYRSAETQLSYLASSASLLQDFYPITMVNSTLNSSISEYLEKMGCTSYSVTQLKGLDNRAYLNALAAVKYYGRYEDQNTFPYGYEVVAEKETKNRTSILAENQYALPIGYTYSDAVSEEALEQYEVTERQEVMMQNVVLHEAEKEAASQVNITGKRIKLESCEEKGIQYSEQAFTAQGDRKKYRLDLNFKGLEHAETYLVFKNAKAAGETEDYAVTLTAKAGGNQTSYKFQAENYRYATGQQDYVLNLGYFEEALTSCSIWMDAEGTLCFDEFYIYCQPMDDMEAYTKARKEQVLENVEIDTNRVSGTISLPEEKYLVLSIPYQKGWTAYVDGQKAELLQANYMYMALELDAGEHTVELTFEIPAVKYALVIMAGSVVLFTVLCLAAFVKGKIKKKRS